MYKRQVVTVIGKDQVGIIAKVSTLLYEVNANILDISQTVLQNEFFTMIMLIELSEMNVDFPTLKEKLEKCAQESKTDIKIQREEIFTAMHRI